MRQLRKEDINALTVMEGGAIPYVYDDSKFPTRRHKPGTHVGGTLTAGVGHTGPDVAEWVGKDIPQAQITKWLDEDTDVVEKWVNKNVKVPLNNNQFAVLVFWGFNVGVGAMAGSTLIRKLNAGNFESVPSELRKWVKTTINGKKVPSNGLIKRRSDEISYWMADPNTPAPTVAKVSPHEPSGTQVGEVATPATVTKDNISWAAGIATTVLGAATDGPIAYVLAGCAAVAFAVALYFFVSNRLSAK